MENKNSIYNKLNQVYNIDVSKDKTPGLHFGHKLSNMDEFRVSALHFEEFGKYVNYPENRHVNSRYMKFWNEEKRRCIEGYNIGRDWIPGYYYWYLNYSLILKIKIKDKDLSRIKEGKTVKADRVLGFADVWDYDYYYFHYLEEAENGGKHASVLKSRGKGYSFKGASMCTRNFFLIRDSKSFIFASSKEFLDGGDGIMSKIITNREFINSNTPFFKHSQKKNTSMHIRASRVEKIKGQELERGYMSEIIAVSLKNDPDKARGKRGKLILWEEAGEFPELMKGWGIAQESVGQDSATFGLMVAFGTGGSKVTSFRTLNNLFNKPTAYNIHSIPNIWSKKAGKLSGFFVPSYANINGFMDKNGNSDIVKAFEREESLIEKMELVGAEKSMIQQKKSERPKIPEEALLRNDTSIFPIQKLSDRIAELETRPEIENTRYVGRMIINELGKSDFLVDFSKIPIDVFPVSEGIPLEGAIVIYEKPYKMGDSIPDSLYIAGTDPYDHDKSTTDSLGSTYIINRVTRQIVAAYTGRPRKASIYHEQVRLLMLYYNARNNFENNLLGMKEHFEKKGCTYLLARDLQLFRKISKYSKVDREFGTPGTSPVNRYARELIKGYLEDKITKDSEKELIDTIEDLPLLYELRDWDSKRNFDRVSAFGMLVLYEQELSNLDIPRYEGKKIKKNTEDSDFWEDNMKGYDTEFF